MASSFSMVDWAADKKPVWEAVVAKHGGNPEAINWGTWAFFDWTLGKAWVTVGTASKARKFGWARYDDSLDAWLNTFRAFENAGILPLQDPPPEPDAAALGLRPNPAEAVEAKLAAAKAKGGGGGAPVNGDGADKASALHVEKVSSAEVTTVVS